MCELCSADAVRSVLTSAMIACALGSPSSPNPQPARSSSATFPAPGDGARLVIYGIVLSLAASVCFNLNNLMEKRAVDQMAQLSVRRTGHMVVTLLRSPLWLGGFVLGVFVVALLTLAYSLVSIAIVQSIFGAGIVLLVPASRLWLGEHLGKREVGGLGLIVVAVVLVSVSLGSSSTPIDSLSLARVMVVSGLTLLSAGLLFGALRRSSTDVSIALGASCGLIYGVASIQSKSASVLLDIVAWRTAWSGFLGRPTLRVPCGLTPRPRGLPGEPPARTNHARSANGQHRWQRLHRRHGHAHFRRDIAREPCARNSSPRWVRRRPHRYVDPRHGNSGRRARGRRPSETSPLDKTR